MSRPGKFCSIQPRNFSSRAIMSSYLPWIGHSLIIHTWPSRLMICALISPTFSYIRSFQSFSPLMIPSRASFTQPGQSESVWRGQPSVGLVFSHDFSSGLSDHAGVNEGFGLRLFQTWIVLNTTPAVRATVSSITFQARDLSVFGICGYLVCVVLKALVFPKNQCQINRGLAVPKTTYNYLDAFAGFPV